MVLGHTRKTPGTFRVEELARLEFSLGLNKAIPWPIIDQNPRQGGLADLVTLPIQYDLARFLDIGSAALLSYDIFIYIREGGIM